jgi:SAM-dependent methyltransferase
MSTDLAWKQWGDKDPYYGVITDEQYRSRNLTAESKKAFFESGRLHVEHVLATCAAQLKRKFEAKRVLDFGCGVGRLVVPFARRAEQVVGIDISEGMLAEARRNCDEQELRNVTLLLSDDELSALEGSFDLIHASIVFQHIEVPRGRELFRRLLLRLAPNGMAAVHFTYAKQAYADNWGWPPDTPATAAGPVDGSPKPRGLRSLLPFRAGQKLDIKAAIRDAAGRDPEMQMNCYRLNEIFFMIQQAGATSMRCEFADHGGELGVVLFFERP